MDQQPNIQITNGQQPTGDHDLLLTLKATMETKLDRVISDVKDLNDNFAGRVNNLQTEKLDISTFNAFRIELQRDFDEHKKLAAETHKSQQSQIDWASNWIRYGLGALGILNFLLGAIQVYKLFHP